MVFFYALTEKIKCALELHLELHLELQKHLKM